MISKRFSLSVLFMLLLSTLQAQTINFFSGTFDQAKAEAKKQHKMLYVLIAYAEDATPIVAPAQNDPELLKKYKANFICFYQNQPITADQNEWVQEYNVRGFPVHLFLDEEGGLLLKTSGTRMRPDSYFSDIENAIRLSKTKTLSAYAAEYKKGNRDLNFLKSYLLKFEELDIPVHQDVLDEYVSVMPVNALDDYQTILFIMQRGPVLSGRAYKAARLNQKLVDSIYKVRPLTERLKINDRIIKYSMAQAKRTKNENLAFEVANYSASTWKNDFTNASNARSSRMMDYYRVVNDTAKYLYQASSYYQNYYLSLRDSIQKPGPAEPFVLPKPTPGAPFKRDTTVKITEGNTTFYKGRLAKEYTISSISSGNSISNPKNDERSKAMSFAMYLNNGAYSMYTMHTRNPEYLKRAVVWVRRSIELFPDNPAYYDTLSHLYYQQKKYDEAISTQQKAIELVKMRKNPVSVMMTSPGAGTMPDPSITRLQDGKKTELARYEAALEKMKSKTLE